MKRALTVLLLVVVGVPVALFFTLRSAWEDLSCHPGRIDSP